MAQGFYDTGDNGSDLVHSPFMEWRELLERLVAGQDLTSDEAETAMTALMQGAASDIETTAFLIALRAKGASGAELAVFARVMQEHAVRIEHPLPNVLDTCGTGGGSPSFNLSTAAAIVASAAGAKVAKHGNRAMTSRCGSADVLEALGVNISAPLEVWNRALNDLGLAFLFAPQHHPAMRHVGSVRKALGIRTVFNQLGPLANPARASRQIIGVYDDALLQPMAEAAHALGIERAWIVRGQDGLDEVSPCAPTKVAEVGPRGVKEFTVNPAEFGMHPVSDEALQPGDTADDNAAILLEAISQPESARSAAILPSAASALYISGHAESITDALKQARATIASGAAVRQLAALREATNG